MGGTPHVVEPNHTRIPLRKLEQHAALTTSREQVNERFPEIPIDLSLSLYLESGRVTMFDIDVIPG